jgi:aspartyl aminopeptidase
MKDQLASGGFNLIKETEAWTLEAGKSYYFTRNGTTLVAFTVGSKCAESGVDLMKVIGCHTDSPCIKTAPFTKMDNKLGYQQVNMQLYGGGIWRTWFDRDLGLAGRVVYKKDNVIHGALWDSKSPVMNVPSLCIHLCSDGNK